MNLFIRDFSEIMRYHVPQIGRFIQGSLRNYGGHVLFFLALFFSFQNVTDWKPSYFRPNLSSHGHVRLAGQRAKRKTHRVSLSSLSCYFACSASKSLLWDFLRRNTGHSPMFSNITLSSVWLTWQRVIKIYTRHSSISPRMFCVVSCVVDRVELQNSHEGLKQ